MKRFKYKDRLITEKQDVPCLPYIYLFTGQPGKDRRQCYVKEN